MSYPGGPLEGPDEPDKRDASETPVEEAASEKALPPGDRDEKERREAVASEELQPGTWSRVAGEEEGVQPHGDLPGVQAHTSAPDMQKRDLQETPDSGPGCRRQGKARERRSPSLERPNFALEKNRELQGGPESLKPSTSIGDGDNVTEDETRHLQNKEPQHLQHQENQSQQDPPDQENQSQQDPQHQDIHFQPQSRCKEHQKKLKFFCTTDQTAICSHCLLFEHKGHAIELIVVPTKGDIPPPAQLQFSKVSPDSVTLRWSPPEGAPGPHRYAVTWRQGPEQYNRTTSNCQVEVTGLHPGEEYHFSVATLSQDGRQSSSVERFIHTEIPVPESLAVSSITGSSARISWRVPSEMQKTPHSFLVSYQREGSEPNCTSSKSCNKVITGLTPGTDYTVRVQTELQHGGKSPPASLQINSGVPLSDLLSALGLSNLQGGKLTLSSVLEINSNILCDTPVQGLQQLSCIFLKKLVMSNLNARNLQCDQIMHMSSSTNITEGSYAMNPLDLITVLFHCADPFLQQEMVSKMSMCQFAVPLLLPNCDTQQSTLMLWAMEDLVKNYKPHYSSGEGACVEGAILENYKTLSSSGDVTLVEGRIVEMEIAMVSFVRVGESSLYKSQTLNKLISNSSHPNEPFIHHDMPCGDVPRRISDGLVEVSWYLPCGNKNIDIFTQPVAIANLRGDSRSFEAQVSFLCQTSTAVFIFSDDLEGDLSLFTNKKRKEELFLVTNSQMEDNVDKLRKTCKQHGLREDHVVMRKNLNESDFVKMLRLLVKNIVESNLVKTNMINLAAKARQIGILVDEDSSECQNARQNAEGISEMVKNVVAFKEEQLPLHGTIWKKISQLEKERCRLRKANRDQGIQHYTSYLDTQEQELRKQQQQKDISVAMGKFTTGISQSNKESLYFLKWLKIQLDTVTRNNLSTLRQSYKECRSKNPQDKKLIKELDEQISNCSLGPEHFFRELGQIYECTCSLPQDNLAKKQVQHLPRLCAQMLLDGFPVELVDGHASNIPMKWISAVLTELHRLVDEKSRILVLTVLGVQGTGKSTLLNTMFGVQFAVSSGRCTRGAFMLLMKVSEEFRSELKCDFLMVIDTEGLKSPELAALDTSYEHDNELATLVIGLSDITIINVAMENSIEMTDVLQIAVHAFLRMKEVGKKPRCLFVHQNVSDMSAHDNNMRDRNKLVDQLNEMTRAAAKMEKKAANTKFTDVMKYDPEKDSYYIPGLWHGTPPMAPVNAGYSEAVFELKRSLLCLLKSDENICNDAAVFQKWTESLWKSVKFENFIFNFRNSLVADAYSDLCTKYNSWEWTFQTEMNSWLVAKTTVISNCGLTEKNVKISELQTQVRDMLHEASVKLDKELQTIKDNIEKYFQQKDNKVHLVEKYKQDFHTSATSLRQQTWHSVRQCLEQAVEIRKGMEKVNTIKDKQRKTIETKVLELIKQCYGRGTDLSEDELKEEFEKMWTQSLSELLNLELQQTDVHRNALHLLKENLRAKSGCVSEIISQVDLKTSGQGGEFTVKEDWFSNKDYRGRKILSAIIHADTTAFLIKRQEICNGIITECRSLVKHNSDAMKRDNTDYSDTYIKEIFKCIDDKIPKHKLSDECEANLKIHVIGFAACEFQKAHDEFRSYNDPREHLNRSKDTFLDSFLARFYEKDQFLKKAKQFSGSCVKPAVQNYVSISPEAIERKVFELIKHCWERNTDLSELELNKEFDNMWNEIKSEMPKLQQTDVHKNALHLLKEHLRERGGHISEMLSKVDLKTSGQEDFRFKQDWPSDFKVRFRLSLVHPDRTSISKRRQERCNNIITECHSLVKDHIDAMKRDNTDYNDTYITELFKCIDEKKPRISDECEASLKIHVIGFAANAFQKAHDEFRSYNDPQEHLKQFRDTFLESFKAVLNKNDQCFKKAKQFTETCLKPAVLGYISKHLGQAIAAEMKTGDEGRMYNTRANFQFAVLKQLLDEMSFEQYKNYTSSYGTFVKDWLKQQFIERMTASGRLPQLEKQLLSDIVLKINDTITMSAGKTGNIQEFIQHFCAALQDQLVIPRDALDNFLFLLILISVDMNQFITNLTDLIKDMEISVAQEYDMRASREHITERIELLPSKPQDLLFSSVCGCGHQCPFCKAPCEAGGGGHTKHFSTMHRSRGFGRYTWHDSNKLIVDICTTAVISDGGFSGRDTNWDWIPYKEYKETYPDWDIAGDVEASDYWKYVMKKFNKKLAKYYNAEPADIPDEWKALTEQDALTGLKKAFEM